MTTQTSSVRPVRYTRFGCEDLRYAHVVATYHGRMLLGDVRHQEPDPVTGSVLLYVHHFCGDEWPVYPCVASFVRVLTRTFDGDG